MAQHDVPHGVVSKGAGISSGGHVVYCTAGQHVIGYSTGASYEVAKEKSLKRQKIPKEAIKKIWLPIVDSFRTSADSPRQ